MSANYLKQLAVIAPGIEAQAYPLSIINQMWLYSSTVAAGFCHRRR